MRRPTTIPTNYRMPLTEEGIASRVITEDSIAKCDDQIDELKRRIEQTNDPKLARELMRVKARMRRLEYDLEYQGANPKSVPTSDLKDIVRGAEFIDPVIDQYRSKITNRATAIRAMCVSCMSGQPSLVRQCEAVTCALWPFRMGTDPLRGHDIPKLHIEIDQTIDDTEDDESFEEGEDDN